MTDMGFMPQVTRFARPGRPGRAADACSRPPLDRQRRPLVRRYLTDPVVHSVDPSAGAVTMMDITTCCTCTTRTSTARPPRSRRATAG